MGTILEDQNIYGDNANNSGTFPVTKAPPTLRPNGTPRKSVHGGVQAFNETTRYAQAKSDSPGSSENWSIVNPLGPLSMFTGLDNTGMFAEGMDAPYYEFEGEGKLANAANEAPVQGGE